MNATWIPCDSLPQLAWVCRMDVTSLEVSAYHGAGVECSEGWLVEGVWDGKYSDGDFHVAENFFGSGVRIEDDAVHFVPSSASVDRLIYCKQGEILTVSNSLPLLLAATGGQLHPRHDYRIESNVSTAGIRQYRKKFAASGPNYAIYRQLYVENMTVTRQGIKFWCRENRREFQDFTGYRAALQNALEKLRANHLDRDRTLAIEGYATISSGYDSAAVAALVGNLGITACFTSEKSNSVLPRWMNPTAVDDSGAPVAEALGMEVVTLRPSDVVPADLELCFRSSTCAGQEIALHKMFSHIRARRPAALVYTGYRGGNVWDRKLSHKYLTDDLLRGDSSGLGLSEARLVVGMFNVAVPFVFARSVKSIARISRSYEMVEWQLDRSYDRPIPRRILETNGVPRKAFGRRKKGLWRLQEYLPRNEMTSEVVMKYQ